MFGLWEWKGGRGIIKATASWIRSFPLYSATTTNSPTYLTVLYAQQIQKTAISSFSLPSPAAMAVGAILQLSWLTQILVTVLIISNTSPTTAPQWKFSPYINTRFYHDNAPKTCSISRLNFPSVPTFSAANSPLGPTPVHSRITVPTAPVMVSNNTSICDRMSFALHQEHHLRNIEQLVKAAATAAPRRIQLAPSTITMLKLNLRPAASRSNSGISRSRSFRERFRDLEDLVTFYAPWLTIGYIQILGAILSFFAGYTVTGAIFTVCHFSFTCSSPFADSVEDIWGSDGQHVL